MRIGILGYGNLGKALAREIKNTSHELVGVFSRRMVYDNGVTMLQREKIPGYYGKIDTMMVATKSITDVESDVTGLLSNFNTIDSFDLHKKISEYKEKRSKTSPENSNPGMSSDTELLSVILP